jgi:hypothetical protein
MALSIGAKGHLRHRAAVCAREVAHRDAAALCRLDVDGVHACADLLDQPQLFRLLDMFGRDRL